MRIIISVSVLVLTGIHILASLAFSEGDAALKLTPQAPPPRDARVLSYPDWWGDAPDTTVKPCRDAGSCAECHEANTGMDPFHAFACVKCHGGDATAQEKAQAHVGLIKAPGDLNTIHAACGKCHSKEARNVAGSAMALAPRLINHTRFAFGSQTTSDRRYAVTSANGLQELPRPPQPLAAATIESLGDDLLRRSCLRCHLHTAGSTRWGEHRGLGCAACHVAYPNSSDGRHIHRITRRVGTTACLKCHNANHVGADYVGLFEKDSERGFRSPVVDGRQAPRIYGAEQHRLRPDVHFRAAMDCMDCHTLDEVHGSGRPPASAEATLHHEDAEPQGLRTGKSDGETSLKPGAPLSSRNGVKITCAGCHQTGEHPGVKTDAQGRFVLRRLDRIIPKLNERSVPHRVEAHRDKLRCSACHSAWSFQDYGFHLMLEERADYWKWASNAAQNDPQIQTLLRRNVGDFAELVPPAHNAIPPLPEEAWLPPETFDWLSGETRPGAWFFGYTERLWSRPPLGLDGRGRISVMRPMRQYVVSHVNRESQILMDRRIPVTGAGFPALIINPYAPHTISAKGRACHECHGSPKAVGLGDGMRTIENGAFKPVWLPESKIPDHSFRWNAFVNEHGNPLQRSSHSGAGPLDPGTMRRLLNPSDRHRALWFRYQAGETPANVGEKKEEVFQTR